MIPAKRISKGEGEFRVRKLNIFQNVELEREPANPRYAFAIDFVLWSLA